METVFLLLENLTDDVERENAVGKTFSLPLPKNDFIIWEKFDSLMDFE